MLLFILFSVYCIIINNVTGEPMYEHFHRYYSIDHSTGDQRIFQIKSKSKLDLQIKQIIKQSRLKAQIENQTGSEAKIQKFDKNMKSTTNHYDSESDSDSDSDSDDKYW
jgi:hypothetical protein